MEAAGLAIGAAGLAGLFNACSSVFRLVQKGRSFNKDYKILETKFSNQELRLRAWGRACGLVGGTEYDVRLYEPELNRQLASTLECINTLLSDAKILRDRYGLRPCTEPINVVQDGNVAITVSSYTVNPGNRLERRLSLNRLLRRRSRSQQRLSTSTVATTLWVIDDREKFAELVKHLKDFIDDLEDLTRATEIRQRQRIFIDYEIECIDDEEELEEIELAREGEEDAVSDAASARLEQISQGTASIRSSMDSSGRGSFITLESYFTARTHFSRTSSITESENTAGAPTAQNAPGREPNIERFARIKVQRQARLGAMRLNKQLRNADIRVNSFKTIRECYKCVVVGEASARKTELLSVFANGYIDPNHKPLVFKECVVDCQVDGRDTSLSLWDISGCEDYAQLQRPLYANTDVVIICFLLGTSPDYAQVRRWASKAVVESCPRAACVLAGMEPSLSYAAAPSDMEYGKNLAEDIGALAYVQVNAETGAGVDDVFEAATRAAIVGLAPQKILLLPSPRLFRLPWRVERQRLPIISELQDEAAG